jgi:mannosyltransferase
MFNSLFYNNTQKFTNRLWIYFAIVFIVNFIFKISYLGYASFWYDEIISVQSASLDFGHIKHVSEWDKNPPFYYYCLSVWIKLFNDSEYTVRLLSVIFSSLAAGTLFIIANKYFNKITAIIVSLLFLSSNVLFYYSHEARAYSLVLFLALLSTCVYFNLKEKPTLKNVLLLGVINFLLIYTHYIAGLIIVFQTALMLLYFDRKQKKYFLISLLIILLLTALRFTKKQFSLIIDFNSSTSTFWLKKSDFNYLKEVISTFLFNEYLSILFLGIIAIVFTFLILKRLKTAQFNIKYSFCVGLGSILFLFYLGKITPIFLDRYLIFTLPFLYILIAYG